MEMETIKNKIDRFYNLFLSNKEEGGVNTRYKSWEWCHAAFIRYKDVYKKAEDEKEKDKIVEYLSLHLAFYLASCGMYRGSSFLLQRDYKAHKKAVQYILNLSEDYNLLWDYEPSSEEDIIKAKDLLFGKNNDKNSGVYYEIGKTYGKINKKSGKSDNDDEDITSDTLVTKIIMGTFGCVPAFDRFLKKGISYYKKATKTEKIDGYNLTQNIENKDHSTFIALAKLASKNKDDFKIESEIKYPPMKCVDMYFWEIGYEMEIATGLSDPKKSEEKKKDLRNIAISLNLCD